MAQVMKAILFVFLKFLEKEIRRRKRSQVFRDSMPVSGKTTLEERRPKVPTASALPSLLAPVKVKPNCGVCYKGHLTEKCFKLNGPIIQRREKLRAAGLCFRCLQPGHIAKGCARVCHKCSGRHHELLCVPPQRDLVVLLSYLQVIIT